MRVKKNWNQSAARTFEQMANAIAATIWKLAANLLLQLENDNFETTTQAHRIDVMEEVICYLVHYSDRWIYPQASQQQRDLFITSLAKDLARMLEDSRFDVQAPGNYQSSFFDKLNQRSADYADYSFSSEVGASFAMRCRLGDQVRNVMGERDSKWIPDYILGREAPDIEISLKRSLTGLVTFERED